MAFTSGMNIRQYPEGFSKEDLDAGYCIVPQPPIATNNNERQVFGGTLPTGEDVVEDSD